MQKFWLNQNAAAIAEGIESWQYLLDDAVKTTRQAGAPTNNDVW